MSLLVTGSIGIDSVITPHGEATEVLGGSAVYFSYAAALFTPVRLVAVVGEDFPGALPGPVALRPDRPGRPGDTSRQQDLSLDRKVLAGHERARDARRAVERPG